MIMKKNLFKSLLTICALGAIFAACSNEGNEVPDVKKGEKSVFMKLDFQSSGGTRTTESAYNVTTAVNVQNFHVYFHDNANILKYVKIDGSTSITLQNLKDGTKIADVPATATHVTVYGNIPTTTSVPTAGTVANLKNVEINIISQSDMTNILLSGQDKALTDYTGPTPPTWAPAIQNGDKYAEVEIAPAVSRIEIEGLETTATSAVQSFTLDGIYVNNFFEKFKLDDTSVGTQVQYGATPGNYAQGQGLYTISNLGKLFDEPASASVGNPAAVSPTGTPDPRWTYQVAPISNNTDVNKQLQLVFKLSNLQAKPSSGITFAAGNQFITVRGFKDNLGNIVKLEKGKIYTISKADFKFDESNLSTVPNTNAVGVWLKVTVKNWQVVAVKPNL
ncbi:hypothetical protein JCM10003_3961 [Bacteroides pyogenes JCM 10003]|nr:hypothetical protein JCM10003_3961 [Bacteroides pyogenes JCM 10003]